MPRENLEGYARCLWCGRQFKSIKWLDRHMAKGCTRPPPDWAKR